MLDLILSVALLSMGGAKEEDPASLHAKASQPQAVRALASPQQPDDVNGLRWRRRPDKEHLGPGHGLAKGHGRAGNTPTPGPLPLVLLGMGALGLGGAAASRRRRRAAQH